MFKKILFIIIGIIILLIASFALLHQTSSAEILKKCQLDEEIFTETRDNEGKLIHKKIKAIDKEKFDELKFRLAFEEARTKYHEFVSCVFDEAALSILGAIDPRAEDITINQVHTLNLPDWMKGDQACLDQKKLTDILLDSSPGNLLTNLLTAYNLYVDYINELFKLVSESPKLDATTVGSFAEVFARNRKLKVIVENEIQDAIVALDAAFIGLKELRQAFVMHVHFQCIIKNLEVYRRIMGNLRSVISVLPDVITDASMH